MQKDGGRVAYQLFDSAQPVQMVSFSIVGLGALWNVIQMCQSMPW